ncbi:hypothetical protein BT63DRAFT_426139 [Microthyrium microscopicum]|uniref:GST C-terminal domain-containing protein n=1 Tax=Microthyrium microscopicum TaxID=703497 RepID=A0A6A6UBB6_9PEZI|nr:hypothetical protein BT63DRAFT_426139 [Microthyrium microscopicum]
MSSQPEQNDTPVETASPSSTQTIIPTLHILSSSQAFRTLWLLEEIALAHPNFQFYISKIARHMPPYPELGKIHPLGKSPILTLTTTDSSPLPCPQIHPGVLTESRLILLYLTQTFAPDLFIPEAKDLERDTFFQEFANSTFASRTTFSVLFQSPGDVMPWGISHIWRAITSPILSHFHKDDLVMYAYLEEQLSEEKPWFGGARIGLSDFNASWAMDNAHARGYFDGAKWPRLEKWRKMYTEREGYRRALEKGGKYDLSTSRW